jgi:hypothetical protein
MPYHSGDPFQDQGWQPTRFCPVCDSSNLEVGCQYQDCEKCADVESSTCRDCGAIWGGANYWQPLVVRAK